MNVQITKQRHSIVFIVTAPEPITEAEAKKIQAEAGYLPAGYGFYCFISSKVEGNSVTTWSCSHTAD